MKLQRQHFSPQSFKDPEWWSGRSLELTTSRVTARCTTKWATGARIWIHRHSLQHTGQIHKTPFGGSRPDIFEELASRAKYLLAIQSGFLLFITLVFFQWKLFEGDLKKGWPQQWHCRTPLKNKPRYRLGLCYVFNLLTNQIAHQGFWIFNWLTLPLDSEDGFRTGCRNVSH